MTDQPDQFDSDLWKQSMENAGLTEEQKAYHTAKARENMAHITEMMGAEPELIGSVETDLSGLAKQLADLQLAYIISEVPEEQLVWVLAAFRSMQVSLGSVMRAVMRIASEMEEEPSKEKRLMMMTAPLEFAVAFLNGAQIWWAESGRPDLPNMGTVMVG